MNPRKELVEKVLTLQPLARLGCLKSCSNFLLAKMGGESKKLCEQVARDAHTLEGIGDWGPKAKEAFEASTQHSELRTLVQQAEATCQKRLAPKDKLDQ